MRMFPRHARDETDVPGVLGRAGGSLVGASWAAHAAVARVGRRAELRTADVLDRLASKHAGPTVLHALSIPIPGISANIDHVVVPGRACRSWTPRAGGHRGTGRWAAWSFAAVVGSLTLRRPRSGWRSTGCPLSEAQRGSGPSGESGGGGLAIVGSRQPVGGAPED